MAISPEFMIRPGSPLRQRVAVGALWMLWLLPLSFAAVLLMRQGYSDWQELGSRLLSWGVKGVRAKTALNPYLSLAALTTFALYCYAYSALALLRVTVLLHTGPRGVQDALRSPSKKPLIVYLRPFHLDRQSSHSDLGSSFPTFSESWWDSAVQLTLDPLGWISEKTSEVRERLDGRNFDLFLRNEIVREVGNLVAIGDPKDWIPRRGANRIYLDQTEWRTSVAALLSNARCVLLLAGHSPGLTWELNHLRSEGSPLRVVVLTTPRREGRAAWPLVREALGNAGWNVQEGDPGPGCVIAFDGSHDGKLLARGGHRPRDYVGVIGKYLRDPAIVVSVTWPQTRTVEGSMRNLLDLD